MQYVIIRPQELSKRLTEIHSPGKVIQTYIWVTTTGNCWETRGLKKDEQDAIANNDTSTIDETRNLTQFLNNWEPVKDKLT